MAYAADIAHVRVRVIYPPARGAAQEEFMQNVIKRITCQVLNLLCALMLLPANVFAAEAIDTGKDVTLTIKYRHEGKGIPDTEFLIYQAGTVDAYGKITLIAPFASYPVSTDGLTKDFCIIFSFLGHLHHEVGFHDTSPASP